MPTLLADETKMKSLASPVFNLKALEFGAFFACFHLLGTLKWYNFSKIVPKHFVFNRLSNKRNRLKIALQVSKLASSPIVMPHGVNVGPRGGLSCLWTDLIRFFFSLIHLKVKSKCESNAR